VGDQVLGERHHVGVVGVGLVELEHRELGVVPGGEPSLRNTRPISNTRSKPPTTSRLRYSSGAIRRKRSRSSALWWVVNGRASAPAGDGVEHRGLDLDEVAVLEPASDEVRLTMRALSQRLARASSG
jgi:hypothetical protein